MTDAPSESSPRRRLLAFATVVLLLLAGGWGWLRWSAVAIPLPADIKDADVQRVIVEARRTVQENPGYAPAWGRLGMVLLGNLFDQEAKACFTEAARLDAADPMWPYGLGLIAQKREPDRAVAWYRQAVAAALAWPDLHPVMSLQLAEALLEQGDGEEAQAIFEEQQRLSPNQPRAALGLGLVAVARGEAAAAERWLKIAQGSLFARKGSTSQLAVLARQRGDTKESQRLEKEAAALADDPPWPDPMLDEVVELQVGRRGRVRRAARLEQERRYGEAAEIFLKQIEIDPTVDDYVSAGVNLARLRDYARALPLLRQAVQLEPDHVQAQYTLALALFSQAERRWHEAPGDAQVKEGFREAAAHAQRSAERKPDHVQALLFWGLSLKHLGDFASAVAPLRKGIAVQPASFELQFGLAEVLAELGRAKEAEAHLENARRLSPADPRLAALTDRLRLKK